MIYTFNRTKVAIKMSRASGKTKDLPDEGVADSDGDSEVEDVASNEAREETPDLYRNSSLGMYVSTNMLHKRH